jgi:hypothetical protein
MEVNNPCFLVFSLAILSVASTLASYHYMCGAKHLSSQPFDNHWAVQLEAAQVLLQACDQ